VREREKVRQVTARKRGKEKDKRVQQVAARDTCAHGGVALYHLAVRTNIANLHCLFFLHLTRLGLEENAPSFVDGKCNGVNPQRLPLVVFCS
jgi:hypothetical protein